MLLSICVIEFLIIVLFVAYFPLSNLKKAKFIESWFWYSKLLGDINLNQSIIKGAYNNLLQHKKDMRWNLYFMPFERKAVSVLIKEFENKIIEEEQYGNTNAESKEAKPVRQQPGGRQTKRDKRSQSVKSNQIKS